MAHARDDPRSLPVERVDKRMRAQLVDAFSDSKRLPVVMLVIQGGPAILDSVLAAARGSTPIICVADSGGAADAIRRAVFGDVADAAADPAYADEGLQQTLGELAALHRAHDERLFTAYEGAHDRGGGLSTAMLTAIVQLLCLGGSTDAKGASGPVWRASRRRSSWQSTGTSRTLRACSWSAIC